MKFGDSFKGYPNYMVSSFGNVMNTNTGRVLQPVTNNMGYYYVNLSKNTGAKHILIHRQVANAFLLNNSNKSCVDHIDHNPKNNNIRNLRFATHQENSRNISKRNDNTSGYIGVSYKKRDKKWMASITISGKQKHIGYFNTAEEASNAYQLKAKELFCEFHNDTD